MSDLLGTSCVYEGFTVGFTTSTSATSFPCLPLSEENIDCYRTNSSLGKFPVKPIMAA